MAGPKQSRMGCRERHGVRLRGLLGRPPVPRSEHARRVRARRDGVQPDHRSTARDSAAGAATHQDRPAAPEREPDSACLHRRPRHRLAVASAVGARTGARAAERARPLSGRARDRAPARQARHLQRDRSHRRPCAPARSSLERSRRPRTSPASWRRCAASPSRSRASATAGSRSRTGCRTWSRPPSTGRTH